MSVGGELTLADSIMTSDIKLDDGAGGRLGRESKQVVKTTQDYQLGPLEVSKKRPIQNWKRRWEFPWERDVPDKQPIEQEKNTSNSSGSFMSLSFP